MRILVGIIIPLQTECCDDRWRATTWNM